MKRPSLYRASFIAVIGLFLVGWGFNAVQAAMTARNFNIPWGCSIRQPSTGQKISFGSGAPSGGNNGDLYIRKDGDTDTTAYYKAGSVWYAAPAVLTASSVIDFASTLTLASTDSTAITVTGAAVGDPVIVGGPAAPDAKTAYTAYVSAADSVKVRFNNYSASSVDPASATFYVKVLKN